jgi:replicative DNA helicase
MAVPARPSKKPSEEMPTMPHNSEAERSILGAVILNNAVLSEAESRISPADFFFPNHALIFSTMISIQQKNRAIDTVTLMEELSQTGDIEKAGGPAYLAQLADGLPRTTNVEHYSKIVKEKSVLRSIAHAALGIQQKALSSEEESWKIADNASQFFSSLSQLTGTSSLTTRREAATNLLMRLESQQDSKILTGVQEMDEIIGGFMPGEVIVYTASTGTGKTFCALQTWKTACRAGEHGLYCSGEMLAAHLMSRELVSATGVPSFKMRRPSQLTHDDFALLVRAAADECTKCTILDGDLTLPNIRSKARMLADRGDLKLIVVDYDELVEVHGADDEWDEQRTLVREMKNVAMRFRIPVIIVSQLRKSLNDEQRKFPRLDDLYGSGAKSKHASIVVFVDRPYVKNLEGDETEATFFVLKSRDGRQGKIDASFNIHTFRFEQRKVEKIFPDTPPRPRRKKNVQDDNDYPS